MKLKLGTIYQMQDDPDRIIDRDNATVRGVLGMQIGEALGHGIWADLKTLEITSQLSNASSPLSGRFGHPGMSENATGKKLLTGNHFRVQGDKLRFDMNLMQSARKSPVFSRDPVEYVLSVAESEPTQLGMSYVLNTDLVWTFADGSETQVINRHADPPENALTQFPVMRPTSVHFIDIVNEGALTSQGDGGMFSMTVADEIFAGRSSAYLVEMFDIIDRWREHYGVALDEIPGKVRYILNEYLNARGAKSMELGDELLDQGSGEEVDPILDLEEGIAEITGGIEDEPEPQYITADQFAHIQAQIALLVGTSEKQAADIVRLTAVIKDAITALQVVTRNQQRLAGEPVVTTVVGNSPAASLEGVTFGFEPPPQISALRPRKKPKSQTGAERNIAVNALRRKALGGKA